MSRFPYFATGYLAVLNSMRRILAVEAVAEEKMHEEPGSLAARSHHCWLSDTKSKCMGA